MQQSSKTGTVIFLNGTSSSGKTTLALALQELMSEPLQHIGLDQFRDGMPARYRGLNSPIGTTGQLGLNVVPVQVESGEVFTEVRFGEDGQRLLRGMRRAIATMAAEGINIVIDDIIMSPDFLKDYLDVMFASHLYFVGVKCPLAVIASRESKRPGRFPGTAESHFDICHAHGLYDVEVDTSAFPPEKCAQQVLDRIAAGPPEAFKLLRQ